MNSTFMFGCRLLTCSTNTLPLMPGSTTSVTRRPIGAPNLRLDDMQRLVAIRGRKYCIPLRVEDGTRRLSHQRLIFHQQHPFAALKHGWRFALQKICLWRFRDPRQVDFEGGTMPNFAIDPDMATVY